MLYVITVNVRAEPTDVGPVSDPPPHEASTTAAASTMRRGELLQPICERWAVARSPPSGLSAVGGQRTDVIDLDVNEECLDVVLFGSHAPRCSKRLPDHGVGSFYILARAFELDHEAAVLLSPRLQLDLGLLDLPLRARDLDHMADVRLQRLVTIQPEDHFATVRFRGHRRLPGAGDFGDVRDNHLVLIHRWTHAPLKRDLAIRRRCRRLRLLRGSDRRRSEQQRRCYSCPFHG